MREPVSTPNYCEKVKKNAEEGGTKPQIDITYHIFEHYFDNISYFCSDYRPQETKKIWFVLHGRKSIICVLKVQRLLVPTANSVVSTGEKYR